MTADNHIHTKFSPDGKGEPQEFVLKAIKLGLKHIAFCEHVDFFYCDPTFVICDLDEYFGELRALKNKYSEQISVSVGLEVGYSEKSLGLNADCIKKYRPDYVINSVHEVCGLDPYYKDFFENKSPEKAVSLYLEAVLASLDAPYDYDAVGHIGYVCRKAPFEDSLYSLCPELSDRVLRSIIAKGKILEINSNAYAASPTLPTRDIVTRYTELGGQKVCFASDAHRPQDICRGYEAARSLAADVGIIHQTVIIGGKETELPF